MEGNLFFGVSLVASFVGGMVALFAPCCITFLLPSYLGTIFKERSRVMFLTLVFALGLAAILVPVSLGFRFIITFFDRFHTTIYLLGALVMFLIGVMTLLDKKLMLPVPHFVMPQKTTVASTFVLGLFSGITSSCCAPVLFAAMTLSTLSPTILTSVIVSSVYVLGIVFPLFFLSMFYQELTNRRLFAIKHTLEKPLKMLAAVTFVGSSILIAILALTGKIQPEKNMVYADTLRMFIYTISDRFRNPIFDMLILVGAVLFIAFAVKQSKKKHSE